MGKSAGRSSGRFAILQYVELNEQTCETQRLQREACPGASEIPANQRVHLRFPLKSAVRTRRFGAQFAHRKQLKNTEKTKKKGTTRSGVPPWWYHRGCGTTLVVPADLGANRRCIVALDPSDWIQHRTSCHHAECASDGSTRAFGPPPRGTTGLAHISCQHRLPSN